MKREFLKELTKDWENEYKIEIIEMIEYNFVEDTIPELINYLDDPNYSGELSTMADGMVDYCSSDLFDWGKENQEKINYYVQEMGTNYDDFSIIKLLQGSQWYYYEGKLYSACTDLKEFLETDEVEENYPHHFI